MNENCKQLLTIYSWTFLFWVR